MALSKTCDGEPWADRFSSVRCFSRKFLCQAASIGSKPHHAMTFPTTHWTLLAEATLNGDAAGRQALSRMCEEYRKPVLAFLAARGYQEGEREDLAQEFFLNWLSTRSWKRAAREKGRFRSYLLGSVCHMLARDHERKHAAKRGAGAGCDSLEAAAEAGWEAADETPPESPAFDRAWAVTLVMNTLHCLEQDFARRGRAGEFAVLRRFLPSGGEGITLEEAARCLDFSTSAVKSAVHRLREAFRLALRAAVAGTVSAPHEVDEELAYLRSLLLAGVESRNLSNEKRNMS
ncbi:MAG TPA: hypothetical protein DIT64_07440 [Verrucomicrobiales bacterium]|nr:hypothetical protein [Verrucomicrobiales bacterium]